MIDALSHFFRGPLEEIGESLSVTPDPDAINLADFLTNGALEEALAALSRRWERPDPRATATQWSKFYFSRLLPPALLPAILAGWQLPLSPETLSIRLDHEGIVTGFVLKHAGAANADAPRFHFLLDGHLAPVISALSEESGLPAKVLWSNAANILEATLTRASALLGADHAGIAEGIALLNAAKRPDGRANPVYDPIRYRKTAAGTERIRRLCCLRYFTDELTLCKSCPRKQEHRAR
ncbi:MAG TPA: siderophore-iron reductase FhuF [Ensifer sp.]|nr:siderophore-iron reductase FhuF [Ensifer sp.]